jgi:hypothetical protein
VSELIELIEHAKSKSRECCEELEAPDADIMPLMLFTGPRGLGVMPLGQVMDDDDTKDEGSLWMTATLAVSLASEVVIVTTAWMVDIPFEEAEARGVDLKTATMQTPVREQPDRTETIVLMCADGERAVMVSAPLARYPDKPPTLGEWTEWPQPEAMRGRFGNAIQLGLEIAREMPLELREIVQEGWKEGISGNLIEQFVKVARTFSRTPTPKAGVMTGVSVLPFPPR